MNDTLKPWGLTDQIDREALQYEGLTLGRITNQNRDLYQAVTTDGFCPAKVSGKFLYNADGASSFPAVGDWVMLRCEGGSWIIHHVLSRKSLFVRKAPGTQESVQVIAANIDTLFICMSLNSNFNLRRMERYLAAAWDSGAVPVVVLTKSDLCPDLPDKLAKVREAAPGADVAVCSSQNENGYDALLPFIRPGATIAFVGSSGVGKSTIINVLMNKELLSTKEIRADGRGRHTTTSRQMFLLPRGGIVIDTPGMREFQLEGADLEKTFSDIEALAARCRFKDCSHTTEPGCAVLAAVAEGGLAFDRLQSYLKLAKETEYSGLNARQIEEAKISRMFGSKSRMKQMMDEAKNKNSRR
ncbi:MAG: ribosome small subunit-dependent GTPase A [Christensenellales bacterium]